MLRGRGAAPLDRDGAAGHILKAAALLLLGAASALAASSLRSPPLAELRWTEPTLALDAATRQPPECLTLPSDPAERARIEVGRAAFRTPLLLGGQAARLGLSCESCHANGRDNPAFRFPGLSGAPGTADVTAPLMSARRGDEVFDPRPIPDLAVPGKVGRAPGDPALGAFIRGLIVDEFDGREPQPAVLEGLVAYVRAINAKACPAHRDEAVSASATADAAVRAVAAARERLTAGDRESGRLMLGAARSLLGRLAERYAGAAKPRARLLAADAELRSLMRKLDERGGGEDRAILAWLRRADRWRAPLTRGEPLSLYNRVRLAEALGPASTESQSTR